MGEPSSFQVQSSCSCSSMELGSLLAAGPEYQVIVPIQSTCPCKCQIVSVSTFAGTIVACASSSTQNSAE